MAYMNQEKKTKIAPAIKAVLKKYRVKGTISTCRYSLSVNLKSGELDLIRNFNETVEVDPYLPRSYSPAKDHVQVNTYHFKSHFSGKSKAFLSELVDAMNDGNHDRSDIQSDYFDVGWYIHINIGKWNKPYQVAA